MDTLTNSVSGCFEPLKQVNSIFSFLYDIKSLQYKAFHQVMEFYIKLESVPQAGESENIDAEYLSNELNTMVF